jgi:hypothetical protein
MSDRLDHRLFDIQGSNPISQTEGSSDVYLFFFLRP